VRPDDEARHVWGPPHLGSCPARSSQTTRCLHSTTPQRRFAAARGCSAATQHAEHTQACEFCRRHPVLHYLLQVREAGSRAAQPSPPAVQPASQPVLALLGPGSRSLSGALPNRIGVVAPRANPAFRPSPSRPFLGVPWPPPPTPPRAFSQDVAGLLELLLARRRLVVRLSPRQPLRRWCEVSSRYQLTLPISGSPPHRRS